MEVFYRTKEEANKAQQEAFLSKSPAERFNLFLKLMAQSNHLFGQKSEYSEGSFVVYRKAR